MDASPVRFADRRKMSKQFKVFILLVAAFSGEFIAYRLGKNAYVREIKDRPYICVAGQITPHPKWDLYVVHRVSDMDLRAV